MNSSWWLPASSLVALMACGSSSGGGGSTSTTVTGTIGGSSIATTDTIGIQGKLNVSSGTVMGMVYEAVIAITNQADACKVVTDAVNPPNGTALTLVVGSATAAVGPGTYPIGQLGSGAAGISYAAQNATCVATENDDAQSGSITISTATATTLAGTFEATFPSGDKVSGSFDAPVCNASLSALTMGGSKACGG
jgi:hypothetical protein